ncbi:hypothetical protein OPV22_023154 [Ensete ventricosum]|uniref:Uncharacterized protein n=1 Tax=Ensete ventricosum TaxID=4639 RepID=A0AAV8QL58_ENSVE|nr:hypothetical protein OPV22_023154 [Ensete ventricosum]
MSLQSLSRAFWAFSSAPPTRRTSSAASKLLRRRAPLVGALSSLCVGSIYAIAYRSKFVNQPFARGLHSIGMEGALMTGPSVVVYVTVPNKEAGDKLREMNFQI